jgi:eukaryotic-like serine/threonine-protein kinase
MTRVAGSAEARETAAPGVLGDRYQLGSVLGRGGMADVFRATDTVLSRDVAVKILREDTPDGPDRARFTAEARTLAQLSHSSLVMVLDAGITSADASDRPFLVMELVEGPTLSEALADGPLDLERVGAIGVQVADALAYAHDRGIVHRDVKPGNVLLGVDERVKLADFGIARLIGDASHHTRTGQTIGTAAYLAPEQVTGREVDGSADVYSLGLVLLEAITGARVYPGAPVEAAVARLSRQPEVPVDLPVSWRRLLESMTAVDPAERPTAAAVAGCLRSQPTGTIPAASIREVTAPAVDEIGTTRPLTEHATVHVPLDPPPSSPPPSAPLPRLDRAGDAIAGGVRRGVGRARALPPHQVVVAAVVAILVLLISVAALVADGDGTGGRDLPPNTPTELRRPLSDLHDAVEG